MARGEDRDRVGDRRSELLLTVPAVAVRTVKRRSYSAFRDMMVVISLTVIRLTSSPSIATMRSPGEIRSTSTLDVRTPETTVPLESALLARMIPSFPGGATMVVFDRRTTEEDDVEAACRELLPLVDLRPEDRAEARDPPPRLAALEMRADDEVPTMGFPSASLAALLLFPTIANCISSRSRSLATLRLCSDICDKNDFVERWEYLLVRLLWLSTLRSDRCRLERVERRRLLLREALFDFPPWEFLDRFDRPLRDSRSAVIPTGPMAPVT
mmetsp:Transcript_11936/g.28315  ORF Transcript_11936/g.28315 Transcript_11936/m.28315 type:complete len:270 (+) Transcript_11936:476-1285(+)